MGSTEFIVLGPRSEVVEPKYVYWLAKSEMVRAPAIGSMEGTSGRQRVPNRVFDEIAVPLPPLPEQRKIAAILGSVDEAIRATQAVIEQTRTVKQGLLQELLTRGIGHTRFKQTEIGEVPEGWEVTTFGSVLEKVQNPVLVDPHATYAQIGIRSHGRGIFHKDPVTGTELGGKRVFWVEPGCLVMNIVFAWEMAVATTSQDESGMIASHRFPMWRPDLDKLDVRFVELFFRTVRGVRILSDESPGGAGRNKTLSQGRLEGRTIPLPPLAEQRQVVQLMSVVEATLAAQEEHLTELAKTKRGLMQDLLTGRVRVSVG
jgi:type I restriction enzyme, S subunit